MTNPNYVRSTDGVDSDNGSTWALANATVVGAMTDSVAGDRTFVSQAHSETTAASVTLTMPGTITNPSQILCASDAAEPATAVAATAVVATTGASSIAIRGNGYIYGISFRAGSAANNAVCNLNDTGTGRIVAENCEFILNNTFPGSSSQINIGSAASSSGSSTELINCGFKTGHVGQPIVLAGRVKMRGGSVLSGSSTPTGGVLVIGGASRDGYALIENFDFRNVSASSALFLAPTNGAGLAVLRSPLLPASWTGSLVSAAYAIAGQRFEMYDGMSGTTRYHAWIVDAFGSIREDATIYRTTGYAVRGIPMSMKMTTSANTKYPATRFESNPIERAYPGTDAEEAAFSAGASKTVTVEFVHDTSGAAGQGAGTSFAFRNDEFALEVQTLNTLGAVTKTTVSSAPADVLAAAADIAASTDGWTTTGLTTPVKQKFTVTIAPQEKGTIVARIIGFKTGKTIYYCPKLTVS